MGVVKTRGLDGKRISLHVGKEYQQPGLVAEGLLGKEALSLCFIGVTLKTACYYNPALSLECKITALYWSLKMRTGYGSLGFNFYVYCNPQIHRGFLQVKK